MPLILPRRPPNERRETAQNNDQGLSSAQRLPYDVLALIFFHSARACVQQNWGGRFCIWQSNEDVARLASVCASWAGPAQHVLFQSCSLLSASAATAFLATARTRPDLVDKVRYLVLGLSEEETWPVAGHDGTTSGRTQSNTSAALVTALEACPRLRHLQVRPLHHSSRDRLFAALNGLESLICSPRLPSSNVGWTECLFEPKDVVKLVSPTLRNFELDAWTRSERYDSSGAPLDESVVDIVPPTVLASNLVTLRLRFDTSDDQLFALLASAGETLERADVYMERFVSIDWAEAALSSNLSTMKELRWTVNPPIDVLPDQSSTPLFDRILPRFKSLQRLSISSTEASSSILHQIVPSLKTLEVQAYTHHGPFQYCPTMLDDLSRMGKGYKLERFTVHDSKEIWDAESVGAMTSACTSRGVAFKFVADE